MATLLQLIARKRILIKNHLKKGKGKSPSLSICLSVCLSLSLSLSLSHPVLRYRYDEWGKPEAWLRGTNRMQVNSLKIWMASVMAACICAETVKTKKKLHCNKFNNRNRMIHVSVPMNDRCYENKFPKRSHGMEFSRFWERTKNKRELKVNIMYCDKVHKYIWSFL